MSTPPPSRIGRASVLLASGTLVSRILGFVSAAVLAQTLGLTGSGSNTFTLANQLPNNIYAIVAGGVLSAVLVPQIVRSALHHDGGQKFINRIVTVGVLVFVAVAVIGTLCAPLLVNLYAHQSTGSGPGLSAADLALATAFAYWCLPQILFYALYSLLGEVLNGRGSFGPFTWAPVLNNVVAILGLLLFQLAFGSKDVANTATWTPGMIALIAGSATLGVAAQAGILAFFWRRSGLRYRPEFRWRGVGLGAVGRAAGWTFAMIIVSQLAGIVQANVASLAGSEGASFTVLKYSWLIFMLPHSIVTVSIATAYFTRMSGHAHRRDFAALRGDLSASLRSIGLVVVFAAVALIVLAYPFSRVFAKHGFDETQAMALVLIVFLVGLVPFSALFVLQRVFYALEDTRTPFFIQVFQAVLFVVGALLVTRLPPSAIAVGIAAVTTAAVTAQTLLTVVLVRRRLGGIDGKALVRKYLVFFLAALPAAIVGVLLNGVLGAFTGGFAASSVLAAVVTMAVIGSVMLFLYVLVLALLRTDELRDMLRPVILRLRHRTG